MAHKKQPHSKVPPANQSGANQDLEEEKKVEQDGEPGHEQDEARRLGNYSGKGEHPIQQPGGQNDANH